MRASQQRRDERFLRGVAGVGLVAQDGQGSSEKWFALGHDDQLKSLPITGARSNQELAIHSLPRCVPGSEQLMPQDADRLADQSVVRESADGALFRD